MPSIGYGEDGLTHLALHDQRQILLNRLEDPTPADHCKIFFRPSFGRSGGVGSAQFGEFDAIVSSSKHIYLIESKWDGVGIPPDVVVIRDVQRLRHIIFTWLVEAWHQTSQSNPGITWQLFVAARGEAFTQQFPGRRLAPIGSLLSRNLTYILTELTSEPRTLRDVLLYFHRGGFNPPAQIVTETGDAMTDPAFELVTMFYAPIGESGYFQLAE